MTTSVEFGLGLWLCSKFFLRLGVPMPAFDVDEQITECLILGRLSSHMKLLRVRYSISN